MSGSPSPMILVTASGPDRPGITCQLTGILGEHQATIVDIGQAVIHGLLSLSILFEADAQERDPILKNLLFKATELGLKLEYSAFDAQKLQYSADSKAFRYALTLMGDRVTAKALSAVTGTLAAFRLNIDSIQRLSENEFSCVELLTSSTEAVDRSEAKKELLEIAQEQSIDIALQAEGLFRRAKRLVVMDMDSTLIENEVIDEFARALGVYDQVSLITQEAMNGKLAFRESLIKRCELLRGLRRDQVEAVYNTLTLTSGASELVFVLKRLGYKVAIISGGFSCIAEKFKHRLELDYAYANQMEFENDRFTGVITPPLIDAQRKADLLDVIAQQERIQLDQVIAIGDGANDLLMLERAGLGIAFNAKPAVRARAALTLNRRNLRSILYLLGLSARDIGQVLQGKTLG